MDSFIFLPNPRPHPQPQTLSPPSAVWTCDQRVCMCVWCVCGVCGVVQVVVVLQQVFTLIQSLLSRWLSDSEVVEVCVTRCADGRPWPQRPLGLREGLCVPAGRVRGVWEVCADVAPWFRPHGASAQRHAGPDLLHLPTILGSGPHAPGGSTWTQGCGRVSIIVLVLSEPSVH